MFRNLWLFLNSRGFPLGAKSQYILHIYKVLRYMEEGFAVKNRDVIGLQRNDESIVRWMYNVRTKDIISAVEFRKN